MAGNRRTASSNVERLYGDNDLDESLLNSPPKPLPIRSAPVHSRQASTQPSSRQTDSSRERHEASLRQELASVRKVNEAIEGVLESLGKAKSNMKSVNQTVNNASSLLNIWTRILSQTEHNQRLILDTSWQGASQDIADMEEEAQAKEQAAARREVEEQERRAASARKAEEDERRRAEAATVMPKPRAGVRGRGGASRNTTVGRAGYVTMGGSSSVAASTPTPARGSTSSRRGSVSSSRGVPSRGSRGRG